jgi:hypothetical protein
MADGKGDILLCEVRRKSFGQVDDAVQKKVGGGGFWNLEKW